MAIKNMSDFFDTYLGIRYIVFKRKQTRYDLTPGQEQVLLQKYTDRFVKVEREKPKKTLIEGKGKKRRRY